MRKLLFFAILIFGTTLQSCKKDKDKPGPGNYAEISMNDIKSREASFSDVKIPASNSTGILWQEGDVFIFKAHGGRYGKFQVISINPAVNYELLIRAVIYNNDGSVAEETSSLTVRGTFGCNLEALIEDLNPSNIDFRWSRETQTDTALLPDNGALFTRYSF